MTKLMGTIGVWGVATLVAAVVAGGAWGQAMTNATTAALSINSTGRIDPATGSVVNTNSQSSTLPALTAPIYTHRGAPSSALQIAVQGNAYKPVVVAFGGLAAAPLVVGTPGKVELDLFTAQVLVDGVNPTNFFSYSANTGVGGEWSVTIPAGVPSNFPTTYFQAAVFDPTLAGGFRLSGTIGLSVVNTIDVLNRNTTDAIFQINRHPAYIASLASSDFKWDGENITQFAAATAADMVGTPSNGTAIGVDFNGAGPNTTTAAALPTGAPTAGQIATEYLEFTERRTSNIATSACGGTYTSTIRERLYGVQVKEQNGAWRISGTQREAAVRAYLEVGQAVTPTAANQGVNAYLNVVVEDMIGNRGGISDVSVSGRQLASVNYTLFPEFGVSTSSASGTQNAFYEYGNGGFGSAWRLKVLLANGGTSNLPLVETAAGPRDTYSVTITWNDGSTSGPYAIPLRAAMDISALPATALAAVPTFSTAPVATLSSSGLLSAATTVNFQGGAFPAGVSLGELSIQIDHQVLGYGFLYDGIVPAAGLPQSKTICTPYFTGGLVDIQVTRHDIFGNPYFSNIATVNL